jgi:phosphoribosyl 1,2-cyclic phosphodiesterase
MKIVLGGVRGTGSVSQPDSMKYGGETTSVLIEGDQGEKIIIDAGTGIRPLGRRVESGPVPPSILLLITHYHLDHIIGLPALALLYRPEYRIEIAAPVHDGLSAEKAIPALMAQPYWPVQMGDLRATIEFRSWTEAKSAKPHRFGGLEIRWCPVHHPGGCTAYRVDEPATGRSVVFATDVEWPASTPDERAAFLRLCAEPSPPGLLMFDGQFARDSYPRFRGWGHSAWEDAVEVAREVKAGLLMVIHHAPQSNDAALDRVERELAEAMPGATLARGGMEIAL